MSDVLFETDDDLSEANIAEWFAAKQRRDFFDRGASVTADFPNDQVTAGSGKAFLETADEELFKLLLDEQTLALPDATGTNYLYATFDPSVANQATWEIGATPGDVADPKLLRAVVDAGTSEVDPRNQGAGIARVTSRNSPYLTADEDVIFAAGGTTVTLASADATIANHIEVYNVDGTNPVTVETEGSETIGGDASKTIGTAGWSVGFTSDGTDWESSLDGEFESVSADDVSITNVGGRATLSTTQSAPSGTDTKVQLDGTTYDDESEFDATNHRFVVADAGLYAIQGSAQYRGVTSGTSLQTRLYVNSSQVSRVLSYAGGDFVVETVSVMQRLSANDTVDLRVFHEEGSSVDIGTNSFDTYLSVTQLG